MFYGKPLVRLPRPPFNGRMKLTGPFLLSFCVQKIAYAKTPSKALSADAMAYVPAGAMSKVTVSHAQKEADDLKRAREEEDTIAERGEKRQKGDGDEETEDAEMSDDDGQSCPFHLLSTLSVAD